MSWTPLLPVEALKGEASAVTITVSKAESRFRQRMTLTVRTDLLDGGLPWCIAGAAVSVECGAGEHAGMLRLSPKGPWRFRKPSGRIKAASISLPPPRGAPATGCRQVPVGFRVVAGGLEITLPDWARAAPGATPAAERQSANGRYVGVSERVPDPARAIQAANGGRVR